MRGGGGSAANNVQAAASVFGPVLEIRVGVLLLKHGDKIKTDVITTVVLRSFEFGRLGFEE